MRLGGPQCWSGCFGKEINSCPAGIGTPDHPAPRLVAMLQSIERIFITTHTHTHTISNCPVKLLTEKSVTYLIIANPISLKESTIRVHENAPGYLTQYTDYDNSGTAED
jgi:hypothetical protein